MNLMTGSDWTWLLDQGEGMWFSQPRREVDLPPENGRSTFR